jgi:hypothetical protein
VSAPEPSFLGTAVIEIESIAASGAHPAIASVLRLLASELESHKSQIDAVVNSEVDALAKKIDAS